MAQKKGLQGITAWCRNQRADESSVYQLVVEGISSSPVVTEWPYEAMGDSFEELARSIFEAAENDAEQRDGSTQYAVRHLREGRDCGRALLKFIKPRSADEDEVGDLMTTDATHAATVALVMRQNAELHRFAMDALRQTAAVSGQAIALLKQSYERIGELEQDRRIHADETVAALLEGAQKKDANADDELAVFTRAVAPKLAEKMVEKHGEKLLNLLGGLIGDDA